MLSSDGIKEQLRNSFEILLAGTLLILGSIVLFIVIAGTFGAKLVEVINNNYGPKGLFNLGIPDLVWILFAVALTSLAVKLAVSIIMPTLLPFHGYCPKCGVKPLVNEEICSECNTPLYRKRLSKFDVKMFVYGTLILSAFIIIWYVLSVIVGGVRPGVDPGI